MRSARKLVAAALVGMFMFSAVGCDMIQKTDAAIQGTVLAKVNGEKITLGEVDLELASYYEYLEQNLGENYKEDETAKSYIVQQRQSALDSLINDKVLLTKASQLGLVPTDEELTQEAETKFNELKESLGENFETAMESSGFTEETLRDFLKEQAIAEKAIDHMVKDVTVTDEEITSYYNENKDTEFQNFGEAETRHLLFKTEEEATAASEKIKNGETTFDQLFTEYEGNKAKSTATDASEEDQNLPIAEDLGTVSHGEQNFDTAFLAGLKPLKEGEISGPVKSSFGYHIIEAKNVKETTEKALDDTLKEEIKTTLTTEKENTLITETLEQWKKDLNVKTYEDRLETDL